MVDPGYTYVQSESAFVPMDAEMDWNTGGPPRPISGCNSDPAWPLKVDAETFAWRMRELHYTTLSMMHGYSVFDVKDNKHPQWVNNETIDYWMQTPLNLTRLYLDKLPVSPYYAAQSHSGYEYIRDHLGYRLELQHAIWPNKISLFQGTGELDFSATLVNWGFAAPINPRPVQVVILSKDRTRILWRSDTLVDPRQWQPHIPGSPFYTPLRHTFGGNLTVNAALCEANECVLSLGLYMPDARNELFAAQGVAVAYSIRLANEDVDWVGVDKAGGVNILGQLVVQA